MTKLIRYKTKPDAQAQNKALIESVFAELKQTSPDGIRYAALMLADGSFVHIVTHSDGIANPLPQLSAFQVFQAGIGDRCAERPAVNEVTVIGNYRMLDE